MLTTSGTRILVVMKLYQQEIYVLNLTFVSYFSILSISIFVFLFGIVILVIFITVFNLVSELQLLKQLV